MSRADSWAAINDARIDAERKAEMVEQVRIERSGDSDGKRHAWIKRSPAGEPGRWLVWRERENGSFDLVTAFYRRKSAEKACLLYEHDGTMKGFNF